MNLEFLETLQTKQDTEMDAEIDISATIIYKSRRQVCVYWPPVTLHLSIRIENVILQNKL